MCRQTSGSNDSRVEGFLDSDVPLLRKLDELIDEMDGCFCQRRSLELFRFLVYALFCSSGPHTITQWLMATGREFEDWTRYYDFFSQASWDPCEIYDGILREVIGYRARAGELVAALDEVHVPKSGKKIPGVKVVRDPLSLPYWKNMHRAQRYLHTAALMPTGESVRGDVRAITIGFRHSPAATKPPKNAGEAAREAYKNESKEKRISCVCACEMAEMRRRLDRAGRADWKLVAVVDGGLTSGPVLGAIPDRTVLIGRTRKDLALYAPAEEYSGKGRRRKYGEKLPTPEQLLKDDSVPWQKTILWYGGGLREVRYKTIAPVLWRSATKTKLLRLIVMAPQPYQRTRNGPTLYRDPAYLLVSDPDYPVEDALQHYLHRWEIEVTHRDVKSVVGLGDAQVWHEKSCERQPQFVMAAYALLVLGSLKAYGANRDGFYGRVAAWRNDTRPRPSAEDMIRRLRAELQRACIMSFVAVANRQRPARYLEKPRQPGTKMRVSRPYGD